jgi:hypothetical protein
MGIGERRESAKKNADIGEGTERQNEKQRGKRWRKWRRYRN